AEAGGPRVPPRRRVRAAHPDGRAGGPRGAACARVRTLDPISPRFTVLHSPSRGRVWLVDQPDSLSWRFSMFRSSLLALCLAVLCSCSDSLPPAPVLPTAPPPGSEIALARSIAPAGATLKLTRVAHSSVLLDFGGPVVLTDPWFSEKAGYYHGEPL